MTRVSLSGGVVGSPLGLGGRPDGIIYDGSGRLFVNVSGGFRVNNSRIEQIDPVTGAVIASSANTGVFLDGLTYDSVTGKLFASDYNNGRLVQVDPNSLSFSFFAPKGPALSQPDGVTSDGQGNLFIASRANGTVMQYNIATNTDTAVGFINGLDDLAPASGLGAPNPVPEPSTLFTAGTSVLMVMAYARCRRKPARA